MARRLVLVLAVLAAAAFCLGGCQPERITVLSYNVSNLFDGVDNGSEYREYDPGRGVWTDSLFRIKLSRIASVIRRSIPGGPDIIFLQEIENENVLRELNAVLGYAWLAGNPHPPAATTVGILSRFPLSRVSVYELPRYRGQPVREILEATVDTNGETFVLFANHWKSKTGNDKATENSRLQASRMLIERVRAARLRAPDATVIMAGDFNENYDEYARVKGAYQTALLPAAARVPAEWYSSSLALSGDQADCGVFDGIVVAFEPWVGCHDVQAGSYYYKRDWETIDHILLLPGGGAYRYHDYGVSSDPDMLTPRSKAPLDWDKRRPDRGYSDHLPVLMTFER
jgi:endonuclease/exonuclease/phosphatase family metal-dependent hydrolase